MNAHQAVAPNATSDADYIDTPRPGPATSSIPFFSTVHVHTEPGGMTDQLSSPEFEVFFWEPRTMPA